MIGKKRSSFEAVPKKTDDVEAEVTSGGRLFQRHQQWTAVYVRSLAARMTPN